MFTNAKIQIKKVGKIAIIKVSGANEDVSQALTFLYNYGVLTCFPREYKDDCYFEAQTNVKNLVKGFFAIAVANAPEITEKVKTQKVRCIRRLKTAFRAANMIRELMIKPEPDYVAI